MKRIKLDNEGNRFDADRVTDSEVERAFYTIARPQIQEEEDEPFYNDIGRFSPEPPVAALELSPAEEEIVVDMVKRAGEEGIEVEESGRYLIWKEAAPQGWGQSVARASGQLSLKRRCTAEGGGEWTYPPICTHRGCRSYKGTKVSEREPKCLNHKGPNTGFVVAEHCTFRNGTLAGMDHRIFSFTYADGHQEEHLALALQSAKTPVGQEIRRLIFDNREDAEKTYSVWQTAFLFQKLRNPLLQYGTSSIALAIGLEREVKEELRRVGLEIRLTMMLTTKGESDKIEFPFGRRAEVGEKLSDLVSPTHGALYAATDHRIIYGGQTVDNRFKMIPLASVQKGVRSTNLKKMESHLHVGFYLAYLFRLRNHLHPELTLTHPHSLNKETTPAHFDANSRELIQRFVLKEFGALIEIVPRHASQFII